MPDFTIRADSVDVEQIMRQIRGRIRDKRGVDYTEEQIRELAAAKLERFLDPTGVRSDLLEQFRSRPSLPPGFLYQFEDTTLFDSDKAIVRFFRRLLHPFLKLLFNPNVLSSTLHRQAAFNQYVHAHQPLQFELLHNLVLELTRASIEVKNLKMRLESVQSRLEFNERRSRALEAVVQYVPDAGAGGRGGREDRRDARGENQRQHQQSRTPQPPAPQRQPQPQTRPAQPQQARAPQPPFEAPAEAEVAVPPGTEAQGGIDPITGGDSLRTRRRRRRRGRRGGGEGEASVSGAAATAPNDAGDNGGPTPGPAYASDRSHDSGPAFDEPREDDSRASETPSAVPRQLVWGTASAVAVPTGEEAVPKPAPTGDSSLTHRAEPETGGEGQVASQTWGTASAVPVQTDEEAGLKPGAIRGKDDEQ